MHRVDAEAPYERALKRIVSATPWLLEALSALRSCGLPCSYLAAGAIRNTVWDHLHDRVSTGPTGDLDVVYFDPSDAPTHAEAALHAAFPHYRWEVTNQAVVHRWQSVDAGRAIAPYPSLRAALGSWPETATAIAVRLTASDELEFEAPFGLTDLFELRLRANPGASNLAAFAARCREKGWQRRWPKLVCDKFSAGWPGTTLAE